MTYYQTQMRGGNSIVTCFQMDVGDNMPAAHEKDGVVSRQKAMNRDVNRDGQKTKENGMMALGMGGHRGVGMGARHDRLTPVECYPSSTQTHVC